MTFSCRRSSQARSPMSPRFRSLRTTSLPPSLRILRRSDPRVDEAQWRVSRSRATARTSWSHRSCPRSASTGMESPGRDGSHARQSSLRQPRRDLRQWTSVPAPVLGAINAGLRATPAHRAANFMRLHYDPSGVLTRPLLTIHAERDPLVPWGHEGRLLDKVTAAGYLGNLSQSHYSVSATRKRSPGPRWVPRSTRWWPGPTRESSRRARCRSVPSLDASDTADERRPPRAGSARSGSRARSEAFDVRVACRIVHRRGTRL